MTIHLHSRFSNNLNSDQKEHKILETKNTVILITMSYRSFKLLRKTLQRNVIILGL